MKTIIPIIHLYSILKNTVGIIFENFLICSWKAIHMRIIDLKIGNGKVLSRSSSLVGYFILVFPVMGKNKNGGLFFIENIYMFVLKNYLINSSYQIVWSGFQSNSVISIKKNCDFILLINVYYKFFIRFYYCFFWCTRTLKN